MTFMQSLTTSYQDSQSTQVNICKVLAKSEQMNRQFRVAYTPQVKSTTSATSVKNTTKPLSLSISTRGEPTTKMQVKKTV